METDRIFFLFILNPVIIHGDLDFQTGLYLQFYGFAIAEEWKRIGRWNDKYRCQLCDRKHQFVAVGKDGNKCCTSSYINILWDSDMDDIPFCLYFAPIFVWTDRQIAGRYFNRTVPALASKVVSDLIMYAFTGLLSSLSHAADKRQSNKMK